MMCREGCAAQACLICPVPLRVQHGAGRCDDVSSELWLRKLGLKGAAWCRAAGCNAADVHGSLSTYHGAWHGLHECSDAMGAAGCAARMSLALSIHSLA
jgi:hypothetical protein